MSQMTKQLSSSKGALRNGARIVILVLMLNQICMTRANVMHAHESSQKMIESNDKELSAEGTRVHPYGSSFEAINKKDESGAAQSDPIDTAASHYHHHSGGAKGWLDMGAWTKKKGAFGWYADFPVGGKGK